MIRKYIPMEFILTWGAAEAVNSWLHRNDMSNHSIEFTEGLHLYFAMADAISKCVNKHEIRIEANIDPNWRRFHKFTTKSCGKTFEWINAKGDQVNKYIHFLDRVCEIRDTICEGVEELRKEIGFSIKGELICEQQTNYWLKQAQNKGRLEPRFFPRKT